MLKKRTGLVFILILLMPLIPYFICITPENDKITVIRSETGAREELELTDYLVGALAGEMPVTYEDEALKAQAVAVYSFMLYTKENGGSLCDSSTHCICYIDKDEQRERWGEDYANNRERLEDIVNSVLHLCITYQGEPINALFFALSPGTTRDAAEIWGQEYPYLVSVDSSYDKSAVDLMQTLTFTKEEAVKRLEDKGYTVNNDEIKLTNVTNTGFVNSANLFGNEISGSEVRNIFSLNSENFTVTLSEDTVSFTVYGKGHCVGMSQYGANLMAINGYSYGDILAHYYKNTAIEKTAL